MTRYQIRRMFGDSSKADKLKETNYRCQKKLEHARLINKVHELKKRVEELEKLIKSRNINLDDSYESDCSVESVSDWSDDSNDSDYE